MNKRRFLLYSMLSAVTLPRLAQAAYDDIVGARSWGHVDPGLLDVVGPSKGLQASAVQP